MLSKPAGGKQPTPQPWPSPPEMAPYRRIWSPILGAYASNWLGTMPRASEYAFLQQWAGLKPLKRSGGAAMMVMNLALPSEHFEGFRPAHYQEKTYLLAWGIVPHWSNMSQRDFWPFRWRLGAISGSGGHGDEGTVGHWPLAIGCLVLLLARILHNSRNSINAHTQSIFFWPKIFSPF